MFLLRTFQIMLVGSAILLAAEVSAANVNVSEVPNYWRLENYTSGAGNTGGVLVLWYATASSGAGSITFPGTSCNSVTVPDASSANKLFALVLAAKFNARKIFIFLDNVTCNVISFGIDN